MYCSLGQRTAGSQGQCSVYVSVCGIDAHGCVIIIISYLAARMAALPSPLAIPFSMYFPPLFLTLLYYRWDLSGNQGNSDLPLDMAENKLLKQLSTRPTRYLDYYFLEARAASVANRLVVE